jgi:hypothetical protein
MTDRPITRIVSPEQALGIVRNARVVGPHQATLLDAPAPTLPPNQPTLVTVHSALRHPVTEARPLPPSQPSIVTGVPRAILDDVPTVRIGQPAAQPAPTAAVVALPPPAAMIRRRQAIAVVVAASLGAALVTFGIVTALYERPPAANPAPQPTTEPARDAVLQPRH